MSVKEHTGILARLKKFVPYALHLTMIIAVAVYVLAGALAIRKIEAAMRESTRNSSETTYGEKKRRDTSTNVFKKPPMQRSRRCVITALHRINEITKCETAAVNSVAVHFLDNCYRRDLRENFARNRTRKDISGTMKQFGGKESKEWSLMDAVLFCFTVITTIGYGNVAPQTTEGRLFVIVYGLVGIPFTMLAIANLGKFLAEMLKQWTKMVFDIFSEQFARLRQTQKASSKKRIKEKEALVTAGNNNGTATTTQKVIQDNDDETDSQLDETQSVETGGEALTLFIAFVLYIVVGSMLIATYEPEMDFFGAIYFNFVSLTTVGLGDLVPKNETYLLLTLIYCAVGLALTTIAIEIAADYLKKLHYFGRKIDNVANVQIWFGGKKLTMKQLVKNLGDQFNLPVDEIADLNLDHFVDAAIKVEAGELATLRQPTPQPILRPIYVDSASVVYVDEDELYHVSSNPSLELLIGHAPSRPSSPLVMVNEFAAFAPSPPPMPSQETAFTFDDVQSLSLNSRSAVHIENAPDTLVSSQALPDMSNLESLLEGAKTKASPPEYRLRRNYSKEARKRYHEYQQQWKKFRTTQNQ